MIVWKQINSNNLKIKYNKVYYKLNYDGIDINFFS